MDSLKQLLPRDPSDFGDDDRTFEPGMGSLVFVFFALLLLTAVLSLALICLRRKRLARQQQTLLPAYHHYSHHRSASMTNVPPMGPNDSVFVYDEKMNLIANSSSPPSSAVPEIRITFPDDDTESGQQKAGRVVVVHVTDTGSVGMSPLGQQNLPPYQPIDGGRFQSLDLDRIGGLREKESSFQRSA